MLFLKVVLVVSRSQCAWVKKQTRPFSLLHKITKIATWRQTKKMLNYVVLFGEGGLLRKAIYNIRSIDMSFKALKSRRSALAATAICVLATFAATCACLAADPWPSYELVANGDFEAGNLVPNKKATGYGNYQEGTR